MSVENWEALAAVIDLKCGLKSQREALVMK